MSTAQDAFHEHATHSEHQAPGSRLLRIIVPSARHCDTTAAMPAWLPACSLGFAYHAGVLGGSG